MFGVVHVESEIKTTTEWICSHICNSLIIVFPVCFGLALFEQSLIKFRLSNAFSSLQHRTATGKNSGCKTQKTYS